MKCTPTPAARGSRIAARSNRVAWLSRTSAFCLLASALLLAAGCVSQVTLVVEEGNYRTYEHAFTEAGAVAARRAADESCRSRKRVAVKTTSTCSLDRCTTNYQCMSPDDAARFK